MIIICMFYVVSNYIQFAFFSNFTTYYHCNILINNHLPLKNILYKLSSNNLFIDIKNDKAYYLTKLLLLMRIYKMHSRTNSTTLRLTSTPYTKPKSPYNYLFPLADVFENEQYPHARTLRGGKKLSDAFWSFAGTLHLNQNGHAGFFDYITLGLPLLTQKMFYWAKKEDFVTNAYALLVAIPTSILHIAFTAARYAFSTLLTLVSLPIIALVTLFSSLIARPMKNEIEKKLGGAIDDRTEVRYENNTYFIGKRCEKVCTTCLDNNPHADIPIDDDKTIENLYKLNVDGLSSRLGLFTDRVKPTSMSTESAAPTQNGRRLG
jgi:hypothetical protein